MKNEEMKPVQFTIYEGVDGSFRGGFGAPGARFRLKAGLRTQARKS